MKQSVILPYYCECYVCFSLNKDFSFEELINLFLQSYDDEMIGAISVIAESYPYELYKHIIKKLKDNGVHIHSAMGQAFSSLYGYTSDEDGIRHGGIDFKNAPAEDAKYMLVSCSAFVNYLIEKYEKVQMDE